MSSLMPTFLLFEPSLNLDYNKMSICKQDDSKTKIKLKTERREAERDKSYQNMKSNNPNTTLFGISLSSFDF